jgi:hypothetical protein
MSTSTPDSDRQSRAFWESELAPLTRREQMQKRGAAYMAENAATMLALSCFLCGVILTNGFYQVLLATDASSFKWPDIFVSASGFMLSASSAYAAYNALKRRGDQHD